MADTWLPGLPAFDPADSNGFDDLLLYGRPSEANVNDRDQKAALFDVHLMMLRRNAWWWSDFHNSQPSEVFVNVSGAGSSNGADNADAKSHPGVQRVECGTTSTGYGLWTSASAYGFKVGGGRIKLIAILKTDGTLSNGTDRYTLACGLTDTLAAHAPTNCIMVRYRDDVNSGKWQLVCRSGGSESVADIGVTVATDTWYRIEIDINAAGDSVTATVNGTTSAAVVTNITATQMYFQMGLVLKSLGTANRRLLIDAGGWVHALTNAR